MMTPPRSNYLQAAGHEMHVTEWGDRRNPALIMWHGLARTGRDFDEAAAALSDSHFVLCPDTIGRGLSSWADPKDYNPVVYAQTAVELLAAYGIERFDWVGTSMGGIIGMLMAGAVVPERVNRLVLNDIGPVLAPAALKRIGAYVGNPPSFDRVSAFEAWLRETYAPFGRHSDAFWRRMADTSARRLPDGRITVHYDPAIAKGFSEIDENAEGDLWPQYDAIKAKTLVLRGEQSDLLSGALAREMTQRGPRATLLEFPDVGHAPTLASEEQIGLVKAFLAG